MTRIFLSLAIFTSIGLFVALGLGLAIGDATQRDLAVQSRVTVHMLTGAAALVFSMLVHALVVTYFMGTGRWLEETCNAYKLGDAWQKSSKDLKWKMYPAMMTSLLLLITAGALGAAADPASPVNFRGFGPLTAAQVHLVFVSLTILVNLAVNFWEFVALTRNGQLVNEVLGRVRQIRIERGLEV